ncbi:MAG: nucleotidyltransferase domain-containing protein [Candidatus Woesearchaeota archaeon]
MSSLNTISQDEIKNAVKKIAENNNPQKIIMFGSYATDKFNEYSDLDLLIIKKTDLPIRKRGREIRKNLRGLKFPIDIVVYTPEEINEWKNEKHSFISKILKEGKILYDRQTKEIDSTVV